MSQINTVLSGAERKAALCQLLEQEAELIASIGRHKIVADKERKELQVKKFLDMVMHRDWNFISTPVCSSQINQCSCYLHASFLPYLSRKRIYLEMQSNASC